METCACCSYKTIEGKGNYEICPVCYWEDDPVQEADPWFEGGANHPSLFVAQSNYKKYGAMKQRFRGSVRPVTSGDIKDRNWRELSESNKSLLQPQMK